VESHAGNDPDYAIGTDGRITFTPAGRAFYTAYFGYAGIDIRAVRTLADFERAGRAAFPFLFAFMGEHLRKGALSALSSQRRNAFQSSLFTSGYLSAVGGRGTRPAGDALPGGLASAGTDRRSSAGCACRALSSRFIGASRKGQHRELGGRFSAGPLDRPSGGPSARGHDGRRGPGSGQHQKKKPRAASVEAECGAA